MRWQATSIDGVELDSDKDLTYERVNERGGAKALHVFLPEQKPIHVSCGPVESIHLFTRRAILDAMSPQARQLDVPVIEIRKQDGTFTRLYIHPEHGLVFSTMNLNL